MKKRNKTGQVEKFEQPVKAMVVHGAPFDRPRQVQLIGRVERPEGWKLVKGDTAELGEVRGPVYKYDEENMAKAMALFDRYLAVLAEWKQLVTSLAVIPPDPPQT